jgi:hypothetical protein
MRANGARTPFPSSMTPAMDQKNSTSLIYEVAETAFIHALEILMQFQNSGQINVRLSDAGAGRAGIAVRNAMISRIVLLVAGCYAPVRDKGDKHLRVAFELLEYPEICAAIESKGSKSDLSEARRMWSELIKDARLESVIHFRHKFTAHFADPEKDIPIPKYDEFFAFAAVTAKAMEKLAHGTGGTADTLNEMRDEIVGSARAYWRPWT